MWTSVASAGPVGAPGGAVERVGFAFADPAAGAAARLGFTFAAAGCGAAR